jgi:hypothetical protein
MIGNPIVQNWAEYCQHGDSHDLLFELLYMYILYKCDNVKILCVSVNFSIKNSYMYFNCFFKFVLQSIAYAIPLLCVE